MKTLSEDTHPAAEKVQIELLREATPAKRFAIARSLTERVISLSRRAIRDSHPGISEREANLVFVGLNYGEDMANRLRAYLAARIR
jgi:hypothetical protein